MMQEEVLCDIRMLSPKDGGNQLRDCGNIGKMVMFEQGGQEMQPEMGNSRAHSDMLTSQPDGTPVLSLPQKQHKAIGKALFHALSTAALIGTNRHLPR